MSADGAQRPRSLNPEKVDAVRARLADVFTSDDPVNQVAVTLMAAWEAAEGRPVTASYVATFADMARSVVDHHEVAATGHPAENDGTDRMTPAEQRDLLAAFDRDRWAGEWNSLPTAIDRLLSQRAEYHLNMHRAFRPEVVAEVAVHLGSHEDWDEIVKWCGGRIETSQDPSGEYTSTLVLPNGEAGGDWAWLVLNHAGEFHIRAEVQAPDDTAEPHAYGVETLWNRGGSRQRWGMAMEMADFEQPLSRTNAEQLMHTMIADGHAPDAVRLVAITVADPDTTETRKP